jgi:ribosome-associated protein
MTALETAKQSAQAADSKKGEDIIILDLKDVSTIADYFVILSAQSEPHLKAIRNEIEAKLKKLHVGVRGIDGFPQSQWIVMDLGDVLVHIFDKDLREFYSLEKLWGDAPRIDW